VFEFAKHSDNRAFHIIPSFILRCCFVWTQLGARIQLKERGFLEYGHRVPASGGDFETGSRVLPSNRNPSNRPHLRLIQIVSWGLHRASVIDDGMPDEA
jgi:hypothetical protein